MRPKRKVYVLEMDISSHGKVQVILRLTGDGKKLNWLHTIVPWQSRERTASWSALNTV